MVAWLTCSLDLITTFYSPGVHGSGRAYQAANNAGICP